MATKTDCRDCLFAQRIPHATGSKLVCRHKKVGHVLARRNGRWYLDRDDIKASCPEFTVRREVPADSLLRTLVGPGPTRLKEIAEQAEDDKKRIKKAAEAKTADLFA